MKLEELSSEERKCFERYIAQNQKVNELYMIQAELKRKGKFVEALELNVKISEIKNMAFQLWLSEQYELKRHIDLTNANIPKETKELVNVLYITAFMACDIIESCVMDMNDELRKHDKTLSVEAFDELMKLSAQVKDKTSLLGKKTDYLNHADWGDQCDNMYEMMRNKARKIIRNEEQRNKEQKPQS